MFDFKRLEDEIKNNFLFMFRIFTALWMLTPTMSLIIDKAD